MYYTNWKNYMQHYGKGCIDEVKIRNNYHDTAESHLCCQPEKPNEIAGGCRLCKSCGGQYKSYGGAIFPYDAYRYEEHAFGDQCSGWSPTKQTFGYEKGVEICCKEEPTCELCTTCGGSFPDKRGALAMDASGWWDEYYERDQKCLDKFGHYYFKWDYSAGRYEGVSFCCKAASATIKAPF